MDRPDWFLDERRHAGPEHLDPAYVAGYDRKAGTDFAGDLSLLRALGLDEMRTLVDLGAGTGGLALAAAPYCRRVVAVDVSAAMLADVQAKAARLGLTNVECVQGGFLSYTHQGRPADVVYSRNALHHLPDFWKVVALERLAALLRPGGILRLRDLVFSCGPDDVGRVVEAWLASAASTPEVGWTRVELATHPQEEYSTYTWLLEPMFERAGFAIRQAEYSPSQVYTAYVCAKV